jgi:thioredoxin-dependent peroxiredoxin
MTQKAQVRRALVPGKKAPPFEATTFDGVTVSLSQWLGSQVWLIFYRYPNCPLCNLHLKAVSRRYELYEKRGLKIVAVFESSAENFAEAKFSSFKFPLIADPEKRLYQLYETKVSLAAVVRPSVVGKLFQAIFSGERQGSIDGELGQVPAHFLIAEDGILEYIYYGKTIADHIPWNWVDEFIQERQGMTWQSAGIL